MSLRLLPFVGRWIGTWPVLTVFTAREEELADAPVLRHAIHEMAKEDVLSSLLLGPLSRPETMTLVRTLMRSGSEEAAVARLAEQAWALSEGNPFVAVETVRAQAQGAVLVQGGRPGLPQLVRDIVTRRLDRLSERGRMLVAVAAVVGREFDFALVQRAAGLGEAEAAEAVEELVRRRVLHGVGELFDFTHDRIREVAYAELLPPRRKLLHRQVAEALEAVYVGDLAPHHVALGTHYREAGAWDKAVTHLEKAGAAAEARAANREAVACFDAALEALQHLSDMRETTERAIDIRLQLEQALMGLGEFRRSMERLREAESLAHRLGDRGRLARVFSRMTYNLDSLGDLAGAVEKGEQAFAIAMEVGDLRAQVSTNDVVARAYYGLGQYRRAIDAARRNEELAAANPAHSNLIRRSLSFSRIWAILALAEVAEFVEGMVRGEEATRVSHAELGLHDHVFACLGVGRLYVVKGELQRAIEVLERSLPSCESGGDLAAYFARTAASLGAAYAWSGRLPEALPLLERAMRQAESIEFMYGYPLVVSTLAEAHQLAGHSEEALRLADRALEFVRRYRQSGWEAWTLRLHGEIAARGDYPERAEDFYREAMALAGERGMRPLLAHCRAGLGLTQARCGRQEQALAEHRAAIEMYRVLDMPFWAARAEAELASVR